MQVEVICTTDDPVDSLEHHQKIAEDSLNSLKVVPTFRPDRALAAENPADFNAYLDTLGEKAGFEIDDYDTFIEALEKRHAFFHDNGCRSSDHALVSPIAENFTLSEVKSIFKKSSERNPSRCIGTAQITNGGACRIGKNELQACLGDAAPHRRNPEQ